MASIAIDLDGVCYEWDRTAKYMLRTYRHLDSDPSMSAPTTSWNYIKDNVTVEDYAWLWEEGVELGLFRYGHVVKDAIVSLNNLHEAGHKLMAVTHRPTAAVKDTLAWLTYLNLEWDQVHILSYGQPKSSVKGDCLIDDKPANVIEWAMAGREAILYDRTWNKDELKEDGRSVPRVQRAYGWMGVMHAIDDLVAVGRLK